MKRNGYVGEDLAETRPRFRNQDNETVRLSNHLICSRDFTRVRTRFNV